MTIDTYKAAPALHTQDLKAAFRVLVRGQARTFATQDFSSLERFLLTPPPDSPRTSGIRVDDRVRKGRLGWKVIASPNTFNTIKFSSFDAISDRKEW